MLLALVLACQAPPEEVEPSAAAANTQPSGFWAYDLQPNAILFGEQTIGLATTTALQILNAGDEELVIVGVDAPTGNGITVTSPGSPFLSPGSSTNLTLTWTPLDSGDLTSSLGLTLGQSNGDSQVVEVPISGSATGGALSLSISEFDFGDINVGCGDEASITVANTGTEALTVDEILLSGDPAFALSSTEGGSLDLPWTLDPFTSQQFAIHFEPGDQETDFGVVEVQSEAGGAFATLQGRGVVDGSNVVTYEVGEQGRTSILIHVNEVAMNGSYGTYATNLEDSIETFFSTLIAARTNFRVALIWQTSGAVDGSVEYIDNSYTASEATTIALEMIANGGNAGDNDRTFDTLLNAVKLYGDWLFEDELWKAGKLNLIAINRDQEQSTTNYTNAITQFQAYKEDPANIVFSAIGGPPPSGCQSAEYFTGMYEAVLATSGVFLSICEADWNDHMEQLATACVGGGGDFFPLTGEPLVSTIMVSVDEEAMKDGWSYDEGKNAIVFDDDAYPDEGSTVEIYYLKSDGCG